MNTPDLSPAERDDFRDMLRTGAERLTRRRRARAQIIAGACAVVLVGAIAAGAIASAVGLGNRVPITTTPTPTVSATPSPTPEAPTATSTPAPTSTSTPTSTPDPTPPVADPEPLTFTFACLLARQDEEGYTGELVPFATLEEVWEVPTIRFCEAYPHGEVWTDEQREAIRLAEAAYSGGWTDLETLTSLYVQCAMTVNGYADYSLLTMYQDDEVRGFLTLCPDRPDADRMRAALPENQ